MNNNIRFRFVVWIKRKPLIMIDNQRLFIILLLFGDPLGARTQDPNIKSVVLSRPLKASPTARLSKATC